MKDVEIYKKLKQLRKERGLTLNTLAEKIGSDYQQISRIERGKSRLTIDVLMKMAEALDIPIQDIVKTKAEDKKLMPVRQQESDTLPAQELLSVILEKIETVLQETKATLSPHTKAVLASQVYTHALEIHQARHHNSSTQAFIDFCIGIMKTLITDFR
jgi:transcriptional regulator with XRE-family HTH domain